MNSEITKITETPGIVALIQVKDGDGVFSEPHVTDNKDWERILREAIGILLVSDEDEIKITLDKHTVVAQKSGELLLGVVVVKSHPVVKSLKRMMRRAFRDKGEEVIVETKASLGEPRTVGGHVPGNAMDDAPADEDLPKTFH